MTDSLLHAAAPDAADGPATDVAAGFRALAETMPQLVWSTRPDGYHDYYNARWYEYTGMPRGAEQGWSWKTFLHPEDYENAVEVWARSLHTGQLYEIEYRFRRAADGCYRWFLGRALPERDEDGRIRRWFGTCTDIDDAKRESEALALLAEAGAALVATLDVDAALETVARLAVPRLADWCAVDLRDDQGAPRRVAVAHSDVAKTTPLHDLAERFPESDDGVFGVRRVFRTGESVSASLSDAPPASAAHGVESHERLRALGLQAYVVVPILRTQPDAPAGAPADVVGAITLAAAAEGSGLGAHERHTAEELARRAATAIDRARSFTDAVESRDRAARQAVELERQNEALQQQAVELEMQTEQLQEQASELEMQAAQLGEQAVEMETANDELAGINTRLATSEDRLRHALESERRARRDAEQANRAKADFLATMSHELRTPLNAILGYADLLTVGVRGPLTDAQKEDIGRIQRSGHHLLGLINDILNYAKVEAGRVEYRLSAVLIDEELAALESLVGPQLRARSIAYRRPRCAQALAARADRDKMHQIVLNLVGNSIKYTQPGGRIEVSCEPGERDGQQTVDVHVRDTGVGIPDDKLTTIFDPFVQVDRSLSRPADGVGLGLAISRDLARGMGGDLTVESVVGEGSTFTLTLPRADVADAG